MGTWGSGLYADDYAADLRGCVRAVMRLPFTGDEILRILRDTDGNADRPGTQGHNAFWLVLADQFNRRGIACDEVRARALTIIDDGQDIAVLHELGMAEALLKKRSSMLADLRRRLIADGGIEKPRKTLKHPEPFVMDIGDVFRYPVSCEESINPYFTPKDLLHDARGWQADGWGALAVIDQGRAFDYLAWYSVAIISRARAEAPTDPSALTGWVLPMEGTLSATHFRRLRLEWVGHVHIDRVVRERLAPSRNGPSRAIHDISLSNYLSTMPVSGTPKVHRNLEAVLRSATQLERLQDLQ